MPRKYSCFYDLPALARQQTGIIPVFFWAGESDHVDFTEAFLTATG